jgi:hypothetical protein
VAKKIFLIELDVRRRVERPRLRWVKDTENDLCELKVKRWRRKVNTREEWGSVIKVTSS